MFLSSKDVFTLCVCVNVSVKYEHVCMYTQCAAFWQTNVTDYCRVFVLCLAFSCTLVAVFVFRIALYLHGCIIMHFYVL